MSRGHPLLVLGLEVGALVDEELNHLITSVLDRVVDRPLILCVYDIEIGP